MSSALKDYIDPTFVKKLSAQVKALNPSFTEKQFIQFILSKDFSSLELKQRVRRVSEALNQYLPGEYPEKLKSIIQLAPHTRGLGGWIYPDFIQVYGLEHWKLSLDAIKKITEYFTGEFAIRVFIQKDQSEAMRELLKWSQDKNHHVRRLASEGCRPRLPWSFKLTNFIKDPSPILPILENLKDDESLYVRKSVANNLNDISKDHPELVLSIAKSWIGKSKNTDWIIKHALRTLLKRGDQRALEIFGLKGKHKVEVKKLKLEKTKIKIGNTLVFSFELLNLEKKARSLRIEYALHYLRKNKSYSKKVFKLSEKNFLNGTHKITRKHVLKQMTTRTYHPGTHYIDIIVNGVKKIQASFVLYK